MAYPAEEVPEGRRFTRREILGGVAGSGVLYAVARVMGAPGLGLSGIDMFERVAGALEGTTAAAGSFVASFAFVTGVSTIEGSTGLPTGIPVTVIVEALLNGDPMPPGGDAAVRVAETVTHADGTFSVLVDFDGTTNDNANQFRVAVQTGHVAGGRCLVGRLETPDPPAGPPGPTGPTGAAGVGGGVGQPGDPGATGPVGPTGAAGVGGGAGSPGATGPLGPTGSGGPIALSVAGVPTTQSADASAGDDEHEDGFVPGAARALAATGVRPGQRARAAWGPPDRRVCRVRRDRPAPQDRSARGRQEQRAQPARWVRQARLAPGRREQPARPATRARREQPARPATRARREQPARPATRARRARSAWLR